VERLQGPGDQADHLRRSKLACAERPSLDEPRHQSSFALHERHDYGSCSCGRGRECRSVLGIPVDPEQLGVLAADAKDVCIAVDEQLEVVVRDASAEGLELDGPSRPKTRSD
jgi:hypothetical protein